MEYVAKILRWYDSGFILYSFSSMSYIRSRQKSFKTGTVTSQMFCSYWTPRCDLELHRTI